jgi:hypothetical protein
MFNIKYSLVLFTVMAVGRDEGLLGFPYVARGEVFEEEEEEVVGGLSRGGGVLVVAADAAAASAATSSFSATADTGLE